MPFMLLVLFWFSLLPTLPFFFLSAALAFLSLLQRMHISLLHIIPYISSGIIYKKTHTHVGARTHTYTFKDELLEVNFLDLHLGSDTYCVTLENLSNLSVTQLIYLKTGLTGML